MGVQLTVTEKITYECQATGDSTYLFFCRAYRDTTKREPNVQLVIAQVKGYIKTGVPPAYIYQFFASLERRRA